MMRHGRSGGPAGPGACDGRQGSRGHGRGRRGFGNGFGDDFGEAIGSFVNSTIRNAMRGRHGLGPGPFGAEWDPAERRGPGGRGRGRMFDGGELRLVLLKLIGEGPRHGYDLIRAIEELTGGAYAPSPGVVYPTLTLLADMELIGEGESEGARKLYAITPAGEAHLAEHAEEVDALMARLEGLREMRERADHGPVRRAIGNLKAVLHARMGRGAGSDELPHDIAAILDEAARKIERL
ncbi:putative PadR family transcriptional regulator [Sphingobium sp. SYK-6]|uniref:PadR family transcriptional regulator n=1 Tax=Sphingobium sp. (strain NBRC 103272 / SYK-6) TaxID=627192 RepID=UPI0002276EFF|nr:putative PadR family transcriptional regulator [Sphingobium sp. SYK-6]